MNRRAFLGTMLALGAAPAIVRAESLMRIVVPSSYLIYCDGVHDDTVALQAFVNGERVVNAITGQKYTSVLSSGIILISDTINMDENKNRMIEYNTIIGTNVMKQKPMFEWTRPLGSANCQINGCYIDRM